MRARLAYGRSGLDLELDDAATTVVEPVWQPPAADPVAALQDALRAPVAGPPLRERVRRGQTVAISACDGTRPQPRHLMIPAVLAELDGIVDLDDVVVLVATGTHRGNTGAELRAMFGEAVAGRYGSSTTTPATGVAHLAGPPRGGRAGVAEQRLGQRRRPHHHRLRRAALLRRVLGRAEAGRTGPGGVGYRAGAARCPTDRRPRATWGISEGNPVHDDVRAIAGGTGVTFGLDVVLNRDQEIVAAFGGDLLPMHAEASAVARRMAMRPVPALFDVVVTTNSGFPLDQNLYQSVKGMSAAFQVTRPGGIIVCAAECRDGFPDHGSYREVLASAESPKALFDEISGRARTVPDQWQVQIQARIQSARRVVMHTSYLSDAELATAHLEQTADIPPRSRKPWRRRAPTPGPACSPKARRPSPTWSRADPDRPVRSRFEPSGPLARVVMEHAASGGREMTRPGEAVVVRLPERFEAFYEREYHRVVGFAYAVAGSWEAAEDATQEAFLRAHREWERVGRFDQPGAWVRRVAANLAVSAFRRRLSEARALVRLAARRQPDPPLHAEAVDFWRAVRSLPSRQRQAVALFYLEDWPVAEIARFLGCTETTVRGHLHRGRVTLARRLGEGWEES